MRLMIILLQIGLCTSITAQSPAASTSTSRYTIDPDLPNDTIWQFVDQMPEYPGGFLEMEKYLKACTAKENWPQRSTVFLQFIIEPDGSFSDIKAVRSADEYLSNKAIECVKGMSLWRPGRKDGVLTRVLFTLPVKFNPVEDKHATQPVRPPMGEFKPK